MCESKERSSFVSIDCPEQYLKIVNIRILDNITIRMRKKMSMRQLQMDISHIITYRLKVG